MPNKSPKQDDPEQYKRFIEAAKKAQADETAEGADDAFKKVASKRPGVAALDGGRFAARAGRKKA